jgi:hypothetical protein
VTRRQQWLAGVALVVLTSLAFAPSLTSPFTHYDDPLYVWKNERMIPGGWEGLKLQWNAAAAWSGDFVEFFPLRDTVYWLIVQYVGVTSWAFHLVSLLFHLGTSLLLWRFFRQLTIPDPAAWLGALLFALHPVHIESVVWIAGLKDPMFSFFMVLGLVAYGSYREHPTPAKYALMLFGLVCGFLVKSFLIAMPIIMLAMELWVGARAKWSLIAARLAGPFIISGIFFAQIMGIGRANHVIVPPHGGTWLSHFVLLLWAQMKYLKQAFLPTSYRLIYCFDPPTGWTDYRLWVGLAVLSALAVLVWRWRKEPVKLVFVTLYVAPMLPVSNLVPFPAIMADRYLYAPSIGAMALLAFYAAKLTSRMFRLVTVAVVVLLTTATALRSWVWQDEEALWEEPDLDPACLVDTSFPAAQAHVLRYLTTKDRNEGLMALERAMVTPGIQKVGIELICTTLIGAAREAQSLGGEARAITWAKFATRMCPNYASAWNVAMVVSLHKNHDLAARAATRAWRLQKTPETEILMWLTLLELKDTRSVSNINRLAETEDVGVCQKVVQYADDAPHLAPLLGEAVERCAGPLKRFEAAQEKK